MYDCIKDQRPGFKKKKKKKSTHIHALELALTELAVMQNGSLLTDGDKR